ncbi:DNL zinc finger-domain-containing protein [Usnea florida]
MMKAEENLSTIFRQLRPLRPLRSALRQPHPRISSPHPFSQLATLRNPRFPFSPSLPSAPERGVPRTSSTVRFLQSRRVSDSASALSQAVAHLPNDHGNTQSPLEKPPAYEITFTCKPCMRRSTHTISKQGYHKGSVLITCPECSNRHVISDHLKIFGDRSVTIEDLMRQKGQLVKRGMLDAKGDVEFWDNGSQTEDDRVVEGSP